MNNFSFRGTGVAVVTPFTNDGTIDFEALRNIINFQIENKVEYLVALGTTGEAVTLLSEEKKILINFFIETINKRVPLVVGFGGNSTYSVLETIQKADFQDITAILSVAPYYNKPSQEGIFQHYKLIAENSPVPVIAYNVPGRTVVNMSAKTTLKLANEVPNIVAIKEASGNISQIMEIITNKPADFQVISGDDAITFPLICCGVSGVISVIANAFPFEFSEMVRKALNLEIAEAKVLHYKLLPFMEAIFKEGSPGGIKALMTEMQLLQNFCRLPMTATSEKNYSEIAALLKTWAK